MKSQGRSIINEIGFALYSKFDELYSIGYNRTVNRFYEPSSHVMRDIQRRNKVIFYKNIIKHALKTRKFKIAGKLQLPKGVDGGHYVNPAYLKNPIHDITLDMCKTFLSQSIMDERLTESDLNIVEHLYNVVKDINDEELTESVWSSTVSVADSVPDLYDSVKSSMKISDVENKFADMTMYEYPDSYNLFYDEMVSDINLISRTEIFCESSNMDVAWKFQVRSILIVMMSIVYRFAETRMGVAAKIFVYRPKADSASAVSDYRSKAFLNTVKEAETIIEKSKRQTSNTAFGMVEDIIDTQPVTARIEAAKSDSVELFGILK